MTIRHGEEWGTTVALPATMQIAADDAELHQLLNRARQGAMADISAALVAGGGDLARTVAASRTPMQMHTGGDVVRLPIDVGRAEFGGNTVWFCSHALIRRPGWRAWRGSLTALMNAQFIGTWDVAPRGHPNDGRLDVVETSGPIGARQRLQARNRLVTGTHLPHPALHESRVRQWQGDVEAGHVLLLDGIAYAHNGLLTVTVEPDAMIVYI